MPDALFHEIGTGFRTARPADASTIAGIINGGSGGGDQVSEDEILGLIAVPQSTFVLRFQFGLPVGCAYLRKNGDLASMEMLAVHPAIQGVSERIIAEAERLARDEMRCKAMTIPSY